MMQRLLTLPYVEPQPYRTLPCRACGEPGQRIAKYRRDWRECVNPDWPSGLWDVIQSRCAEGEHLHRVCSCGLETVEGLAG